GSAGTQWAYTTAANLASEVHQDSSAPTGNVSVGSNRPNLQMNITPLTGPAVFSMSYTNIDFGQIFLSQTSPTVTVSVANIGGASMHINSTVLGGANPGAFTLTDTNTYPYTLASGTNMQFTVNFHPTVGQVYNATITVTDDLSKTAHTLTLTGIGFDANVTTFPYSESFDGTTFPPLSWTNQRIVGTASPGIWDRQTSGTYPTCNPHSGAAMVRYNSFSISANTHAVLSTPPLVLPGNNYRVSFWWYRDQSTSYNTPKYSDEGVSVWFGTSPTDTTMAVNLGFIPRDVVYAPIATTPGWYKYAFNFPASSEGPGKYVMFKAKSQFGDNIFLDDVTVELQPSGVPFPAIVSSPANAAINLFPTISLNWLPDGTGPANTGYRLSFGTDNPPTNVLFNSDLGMVTTYTPTLAYGTTYYWQVVPFNGAGNATGCPVWSFTTMPDPTVTTFPYVQNFDSVTAPALPVDWWKIVSSTSSSAVVTTYTSGTPHSGTNHAYLYNSSDNQSNLVLITPPTANLGVTRIRFWAKGSSATNLIIGTVSNPMNPSSFMQLTTIALTTTYAEYQYSFAGYNGLDHYIGFKHSNSTTYLSIYIDDFTWQLIPTGPQIDLNTTSLAYGEIYNNSTAVLPVTVTNSGLSDLSFSTATSAPTITTNVTGNQTLTPGASAQVNVTVHPNAEGAFTGSVTFNSNDPQQPSVQVQLTATVLPALAPGLVEVGNGTLVNLSLPVEPYYNYSFSQTLYMQSELNQPNSRITSIFYKYDGSDAWADSVWIYMGLTTRTEFTGTTDYVPADQLTLVYQGLLTVPATAGWVEVPLQVPFTYDNASNLVVCVDRDMPPYHPNADDFYCTAVATNRSLEQHSDAQNSNVNTPLAGTLRMNIPDTRFQFQTLSNDPLFAAIPSTISFNSVNVGETSTAINVQVRNSGGGSLTITQPITLTGPDAAMFTLTDTHTYPQTLTAGQGITVSITFTPTSAGNKSAQLNVMDNLTRNFRSTKENLKAENSERIMHVLPISGYGNDGVIHTFPYNQDYEDAAWPNNGWTVADDQNGTQGWRRRTTAGNPHNGTAYAVVGTLAGNHWMMTPKFEISTQSNTLRYWIKDSTDTPDTTAASMTEYLKLYISTTSADTTSFTTQVGNILTNADIPSTYEQMTVDLSSYVGQNVYIAFMRHSTGGKFLYVDDFSLANATGVVLNPPTNLTYQVVNENNVTLTWVAPTPATGTTLTGFKVYRNGSPLSTIPNSATLTFTDISVPVGTYTYAVSAVYQEGESVLSGSVGVDITGGNPNELLVETFDFYDDFALSFGYWTNLDVDGINTYNFGGVTYPNMNSPKAWMVFNPNATTPPLTTLTAHSGNKVLICFDAQNSVNNDWLITPRIHLGTASSFNFWAKSFTSQYGFEKFKVAISTTDNQPVSFTNVISGANPVSAPAAAWTQYTYDLAAYDGQYVYIGIRCVSENAFALLLDDFKLITTGGVGVDDPAPLPTTTSLIGNYPNPFNPETSIQYNVKEKGNVLIEIFNTKGQKVKTLENSLREPGHYTVNWTGKDDNGHAVSSGVYFYKMKTGTFTCTKKMILLK
ncbi:MAG TPA: choice-of-anchor J domain-containing protein, partial [Candidatus Cloacimonadota bacterium]|nr:choice-of-anchor J domain-containing protein [Candidatus Cloacimonadota bacterium]